MFRSAVDFMEIGGLVVVLVTAVLSHARGTVLLLREARLWVLTKRTRQRHR